MPRVLGLQFRIKSTNKGENSEYMLTRNHNNGITAAAMGWVDHYYDSAADVTQAVNALAHRFALFTGTNIPGLN